MPSLTMTVEELFETTQLHKACQLGDDTKQEASRLVKETPKVEFPPTFSEDMEMMVELGKKYMRKERNEEIRLSENTVKKIAWLHLLWLLSVGSIKGMPEKYW